MLDTHIKHDDPSDAHKDSSSRLRLDPFAGYSGNQATYLCFPVFSAFFLNLMAMLSTPIIPGMTVANLAIPLDGQDGSMHLGNWGWCLTGMQAIDKQCSKFRPVTGPMMEVLQLLPDKLSTLASINNALPAGFLAAADAFHLINCILLWVTTCWVLAASGEWQRQGPNAWKWTRQAFMMAAACGVTIFIGIGFDMGFFISLSKNAVGPNGIRPHVTAGPVIFLRIAALCCCIAASAVRLVWGTRQPCPQWTSKTNKLSGNNTERLAASLTQTDEVPPSWADLHLAKHGFDTGHLSLGEKDQVESDVHHVAPVALPSYSAKE